jgi:sigma-B regulation protein RsbU (phosphoserine phosphatase)
MIFVGAPTTVVFAYFVLNWWLRSTLYHSFPHSVLNSIPPSRRVNVLPKVLFVTFMIGSLPVALISRFILHRIQDIQAGRLSLEGFVSQMPLAIEFLLAWALILAAGLSLFLSKSISEPLRYTRLAMEKIGGGDLDTVVPVVSNDDIGQMGEQFNRMLKEIKELNTVRETFGRYLSEEVVSEILKSPGGVDLQGELREITILVSDLRGFTRLSERLPPQAVLEIINRYLERMTDIIIRHEGTIDEFTGDGILVFFGAPRMLPDHAGRAVACALEMQEALTALNKEYDDLGLPQLQMGIGINTGELIVGNIGCEKRKKYGALGNPINVAFRVESHTNGGEILLTSSVYRCIDKVLRVCSTREVHLKGIDKPVTLYEMTGWRGI